MNAQISINAQQRGLSTPNEPSLRPVPNGNPLQLVTTQGQVQIHTSTFRGSFSIVLSEALRSAGLGSNVLVSQFLKGGVNQGPNGAINLCGRLEWLRPAIETCLPEQSLAEDLSFKKKYEEKAIKELWEFCKKRLIEKNLDKIVLDEIGMAISLGFIEENDLISMINNRPSSTDIILTGPSIPPKVMEMADQITELRCN
ncbi:cob(I)yrinic acid a,c-diamide adenosyltransferase [Prochlorococcus marinus]|uniref:Cob(I)alamin adenolsyltransferase n=1 Tax=Prochlorococcus marinus XMU1408 TaxID=2213228 RepID=A0A318R3C1_PROMR|nr:cob(I)yrinic acid a,c-diamide adenosyltransferase [Prochlorococcus marinus]MBW3041303.1 cob(I)alamin adenolsyltransferase [Prochlorococcus marinus str. XMU1408]PYE02478.1 cob(I)alamin adenolsyltransferase [Prochlorococcus marinus XMU1408]